MHVDPAYCKILDEQMAQFGQGWISDDTIVDVNELLTAVEFEQRFGVRAFTLKDYARRHSIPKMGKRGRADLYRLGDLLAARSGVK